MSANITSVANGIMTVRFTGKLTHPEMAELHAAAAGVLDQHGKLGILAIAEPFEGWEREGDWGNIGFEMKYDPQISGMAIVCDQKWEDLAILFAGKGLRKFPVEYFPLDKVDEARAWLGSKATPRTT